MELSGDSRIAAQGMAAVDQRLATLRDWFRSLTNDEATRIVREADTLFENGPTDEKKTVGQLAGTMMLLLACQLREEAERG